MQRVFIFLFCCLFSVSAQAGISDCVTALKNAMKKNQVGLNQKTADRLAQAIVEGNLRSIEHFAKPFRGLEDHGYSFSHDDNPMVREPTNNLLLFATRAAMWVTNHNIVYARDSSVALDSLMYLIEMGFKPYALNDKEKISWGILLERLNVGHLDGYYTDAVYQHILPLLVHYSKGLTIEKLILSDGRSIVHEILVNSDFAYFKRFFDVGFYVGYAPGFKSELLYYSPLNISAAIPGATGVRYEVFITQDHLPFDYDNTSLLHWLASVRSTENLEKLKFLTSLSIDSINLLVNIKDKNAPTKTIMTPLDVAQKVGNNPAVEWLLKAGAKEAAELPHAHE